MSWRLSTILSGVRSRPSGEILSSQPALLRSIQKARSPAARAPVTSNGFLWRGQSKFNLIRTKTSETSQLFSPTDEPNIARFICPIQVNIEIVHKAVVYLWSGFIASHRIRKEYPIWNWWEWTGLEGGVDHLQRCGQLVLYFQGPKIQSRSFLPLTLLPELTCCVPVPGSTPAPQIAKIVTVAEDNDLYKRKFWQTLQRGESRV